MTLSPDRTPRTGGTAPDDPDLDLDLATLFLDLGVVGPDAVPDDDGVLRLRLVADPQLSVAALAAALCRVLLDLRVPSVRLDRAHGGIRLRCHYLLPGGTRAVELTAVAHARPVV